MARPALLRGLGNAMLVLVSIAVALIFFEFALRVYFYGTLAEPDFGQSLHDPHPTRAWTLKPNVDGVKQELDYTMPVRVNSLGVRGPEIGYDRTPGVFRILIVGDSAMFGSGVDNENTVPALLQAELAPLKVEVINLSVAAYSTVQEYMLFMDEGRKYRPDLVLLAFSPNNDIQTNYEPLQSLYQKNQRRPFATLDSSGRLQIDMRHVPREVERRKKLAQRGLIKRFFQNSVVLRLLGTARNKYLRADAVDPNVFLGWPHLAEFDETLGLEGRKKVDYEKLWGEAWAVTQALIREIQRESQAMGARFGLFVCTSMLQGDAGAQARVREAFPGMKLDLAKIDRELERFANEIGAPFIPILPAFEAAPKNSAEPLFYQFQDEHWTPAGSRLVAEALARGLREKKLLPGDSTALIDGTARPRAASSD
jgi:lysophospholipase L1-like esterase